MSLMDQKFKSIITKISNTSEPLYPQAKIKITMGTGTNFTDPIALQIDLPGLHYYCLTPAQKHGGFEWSPDAGSHGGKGAEQTRRGCVQQPGDPAFGWIVY